MRPGPVALPCTTDPASCEPRPLPPAPRLVPPPLPPAPPVPLPLLPTLKGKFALKLEDDEAWLAVCAAAATTAAAVLWAAATAAAAALALTEGGRIGLHGECELPEALEEAN